MTCRDLDGTDGILWHFISGHLMHLHLASIYQNKPNMIAGIVVRPNVILGRQYLFFRRENHLISFSGKI
jgi:hypothetical protein